MTLTHSLTLAELRQRYPQLRVVERAADSDEYNRQRYLARLDSNRLGLTAALAFAVAAACAIAAYHYATRAGSTVQSFYFVRTVTCVVWGAWAGYRIVAGWITGYWFIPVIADAYVGTRADPDGWWIPLPLAAILTIIALSVTWYSLFSFPMNSENFGTYVITKFDSDIVAATKIFFFLSIVFPGSVLLASSLMAYFRFITNISRRKDNG